MLKLSTSYKIAVIACVIGFVAGLFAAFSNPHPKIYLKEDRKALNLRIEKNLENKDRTFTLGLALNLPSNETPEKALEFLQKTIQPDIIAIPITWAEVETSPGRYALDNTLINEAAALYPEKNLKILLDVKSLGSAGLYVPEDLRDRPYDDSVLIKRFHTFLDHLLKSFDGAEIVGLSIAHNIDQALLKDQDQIDAYLTFQQQTIAHLQSKNPDLTVGTKIKLQTAIDDPEFVSRLYDGLDTIFFTYYPLKDYVPADVTQVKDQLLTAAAFFPDKKIQLWETGYPSGELCGSSQNLQAKFYVELFEAWYMLNPQMDLAVIHQYADYSPERADALSTANNIESMPYNCFLESLGLKTEDGAEKPAYDVIQKYMSDLHQ